MKPIFFEDNQLHSTYSDGAFTLGEIFEYNNLHDKLNLTITDHVDKKTDWFPDYAKHIRKLRKEYSDFTVRVGCEVKILDDGTLNTTPKILKAAEVVIGSVHHFDGIKTMSEKELLQREYELTKLLAQNKDINILGHPFSMVVRFFKSDVPRAYTEEIYALCAKHGIKFEYNHKNSPESIKTFVRERVASGELEHLSFGSDMHANLKELGQSGYAMQKMVTVLVTGGGTAIAQGILKGLQRTGLPIRTVVVDTDVLAAGLYAGDMAYRMPRFSDADFIPRIIEICKREKVDVVFSGLDPELSVLAKNAASIKKATGAHVIVSPIRAVKIADDKWETVQFLKKNNFPFPKSCLPRDVETFLKTSRFPLVVKPRIGARSIGLSIVKNGQELKSAIEHTPNAIIQEHLATENDEFTCSAFVWRGRTYGVACGKRWLRNGDTYKAHFYQNPKLELFIAKVATKLGVEGPCNFQLRMTKRGPIIFEINARFSGTTGSVAHLGFNVPGAIAQIVGAGRSLWKLSFKNSYVLRYWNEIFANEESVRTLKKKGMLKPSKKNINAL